MMKVRDKKDIRVKVGFIPRSNFDIKQYQKTQEMMNQIARDFDMDKFPRVVYTGRLNGHIEGFRCNVKSLREVQVMNNKYYIFNLAEALGYIQLHRTREIKIMSERGIEMMAIGYAVAFCKRLAEREQDTDYMQMLPPEILEEGEISLELSQYIEHMEELYEMQEA